MKEILIFAGTTEGRKLSECLSAAGIAHTVCVATGYGKDVLGENPYAKVHCGRMDADGMRKYMAGGGFAAVVDATHPYAEMATDNIREAAEGLGIPYLRLKRDTADADGNDGATYFESSSFSAPDAARVPDGNDGTTYFESSSFSPPGAARASDGNDSITYFESSSFSTPGAARASDGNDGITYFESSADCAKALGRIEGNILLATGSKELAAYCSDEELKKRLYVRVLPGMESLQLCADQGIMGKQILALQGPFTVQMNEAMLCQYRIRCLVTKKSGRAGGYQEKLEAARRQGIPVFVVGQPKEQGGYTFPEVCQKLGTLCGRKVQPEQEDGYPFSEVSRDLEARCGEQGDTLENSRTGICAEAATRCGEQVQPKEMEIILAGVGMGSRECLTMAVCGEIENADILLGAPRLIAPYRPKLEKQPFYTAKQVVPYLKGLQRQNRLPDGCRIVILFSGDSGFYSGCKDLHQALRGEIKAGALHAAVRILPGISTVAYFAACIGECYQDAEICSIHGKKLVNLAERIRRHKKTFLILSGVRDVNMLGGILADTAFSDCEIMVGYQLSYPEQSIRKMTPEECMALQEEGLYCCCIKNPAAVRENLTHGKADTEFTRGKVPMTKEEVREVGICKLRLHREAVLYDIGSGTGSIAIEAAALSDDIRVFAIEKKEAALSLIRQNQERFRLENIEVIEADAPAGLLGLPAPTHAFIGGSGGRLKEILSALHQKNPHMRVVIHAVSMETICAVKEVLSLYPVDHEEIVQLQVSRARAAGNFHIMQAENPVWICSFNFLEGNGI